MQPQDFHPAEEVDAIEVITYESGQLPEDKLQEIAELRWRVWEPIFAKSGFSSMRSVADWIDPVDREAIHFTIMDIDDSSVIAAAARLSIHESVRELPEPSIIEAFPDWTPEAPLAMLGHLVVAPHDRHHSFGHRLVTQRNNYARLAGARTAVLTAVPWRVATCGRDGFEMVGPITPEQHGHFDQPLYLMTETLTNR